MSYLKKQDWEDLRKSAESGLKSAEITQIQHTKLLELCNAKIKEIEDEELQKTEKEITNALTGEKLYDNGTTA